MQISYDLARKCWACILSCIYSYVIIHIGVHVQILSEPFYSDRREWWPEGAPPYYKSPCFHYHDNTLAVQEVQPNIEVWHCFTCMCSLSGFSASWSFSLKSQGLQSCSLADNCGCVKAARKHRSAKALVATDLGLSSFGPELCVLISALQCHRP